eukprot:CAMPEP_0178423708 /NCGR_PEP_ID=MMETSP0689_2-20121128/27826_1 /TAXON_ID=160604 /ORGANISM="Amphidinium massartii, Strain CS-259" /LENGTH=226 /DNA_ID=CAMNT_0020045307 /DNA_START=116 /DNA_END=796 /DNA_ORIENTATION=-
MSPLLVLILSLLSSRAASASRPHPPTSFATVQRQVRAHADPDTSDGLTKEEKDGLAERAEEVKARVEVLQKQLNQVNKDIAKETVREKRLQAEMKATDIDRNALDKEAQMLRDGRKGAEISMRQDEEKAMKAAQQAESQSNDTRVESGPTTTEGPPSPEIVSVKTEKTETTELLEAGTGGNSSSVTSKKKGSRAHVHDDASRHQQDENLGAAVTGEGWLWSSNVDD